MCYAKKPKAPSSCMVCVVRNSVSGQMILPARSRWKGIVVPRRMARYRLRALSLELLLSDHRADCEAPYAWFYLQGLDVERMLYLYDARRYAGSPFVDLAVFCFACGGCIPGGSTLRESLP